MNRDENDLPRELGSSSEYAPYKLHRLLAAVVSTPVTTSQQPTSVDTNNPANSSFEKPKLSRKRSLMRFLFPLNRSRASSLRQEQARYSQASASNTCDMRIFIIRHAERVDRYFGANWYKLAFDQNNEYRPYHRNFPPSLPLRSNSYFWALDGPLTTSGLNASEHLGQTLRSKNVQPHYIYSSPAVRCIFTTMQLLKGLNLKHPIPIRIEPGLLEFGAARIGMSLFFQPHDWHRYGVNVDLSYEPIITDIPPLERENEYYLRSRHVIREIERRHSNSSQDLVNIFIIAHATSPETLTWDLLGKQLDVSDLYKRSLNVNYLEMLITEREQENQRWSLK